jgi:hypothetical protein
VSDNNIIAGLVVETWNQGDDTEERLRLEVDPQRLVALANSANPSPTEVNELMQVLIMSSRLTRKNFQLC